jgi:hypothetical protein
MSKEHQLSPFRRLLVSVPTLVAVAIVLVCVGTVLSVNNRDFETLSRYGALVTCVGMILLARPNMSGKEMGQHVIASDSFRSIYDPQYWIEKGEPIPIYVVENRWSRIATGFYGPIISLLGTLINAFADQLNCVVGFQP